jgi:leucyl/phenylalanyl-tRNA---protein transferase
MIRNRPQMSNPPRDSPGCDTNDIQTLVGKYREGLYPYYDRGKASFCWDRANDRAVIRMGERPHKIASREIERQRRALRIRTDTAFEAVLRLLSDDGLRSDTWIKHDVLSVYRTLFAAGYAHSVEAYEEDHLVGGLVGVHLGKVFCAEAMIGVFKAAAPFCLYSLVAAYSTLRLELIDVQVPHRRGSPCARLGEEILTIGDYLRVAAPLMAGEPAPFLL